ncbi:MAG: ABC transporter permease [Clostridia bacterium]|nr:ABC transporter permease [Clostridia bacterium]
MKQFGTIFKFELVSLMKNKIFVGITVFLAVVIAAVMFFPRITDTFDVETPDFDRMNHENAYNGVDDGRPVMAIAAGTREIAEEVSVAFQSAFPSYIVSIVNNDPGQIAEMITTGDVECAFVFDSLIAYKYYVNDLSMYDTVTSEADAVLQNLYYTDAMVQSGITAAQAQEILDMEIESETVSLGEDQMQNFFYTYIMIFALYMVILLYGQMVATNVATEKSSRAMELLITSAKPVSMMFGKVIASALSGLVQLVAVFGSALLFYNLNKEYWAGNMIVDSIFNIPPSLLAFMLMFFILGFILYAFLYGAIGSTVSKLEEINTAVMPVTFLFIIGFFVVVFSLSSGNADNLAMRICSYIPFTSPMAMFSRIAMTSVAPYEIVISIAILSASVVGVGIVSAKIYRVGVLLYGNSPKPAALLKLIRQK